MEYKFKVGDKVIAITDNSALGSTETMIEWYRTKTVLTVSGVEEIYCSANPQGQGGPIWKYYELILANSRPVKPIKSWSLK